MSHLFDAPIENHPYHIDLPYRYDPTIILPSIVGEAEENWDTIALSSFDSTLCLTVMPCISLYRPYIYHIVWGYYYIIIYHFSEM